MPVTRSHVEGLGQGAASLTLGLDHFRCSEVAGRLVGDYAGLGRPYPGILPGGKTAHGYLLTGLSPQEWCLMDAFEDAVCELVRVDLTDGRHGWAYACNPGAEVGEDDWSAEEFEARELPAYVERCTAWRQRYENREQVSSSPSQHDGDARRRLDGNFRCVFEGRLADAGRRACGLSRPVPSRAAVRARPQKSVRRTGQRTMAIVGDLGGR